MKKQLVVMVFALSFIFTDSIKAQEYNSAAGLRLGWYFAGSYKKMIKDGMYIDLYAGLPSGGGFIAGGNLELHKPLEEVENLYYYYGGGGSIYGYAYNNGLIGTKVYTLFGITGVIGLDYKFEEIPVNISLDWMPGFYFGDYGNGFSHRGGGVSVRYILGQD